MIMKDELLRGLLWYNHPWIRYITCAIDAQCAEKIMLADKPLGRPALTETPCFGLTLTTIKHDLSEKIKPFLFTHHIKCS